MTQPRKRIHRSEAFWKKVKLEYQAGATQAELRRKYKLSASTLGTRIANEGWQLSLAQKQVVQEFKESVAKLNETYQVATKQQKSELTEQVNTIAEDLNIQANNRKLSLAVQGRMGQMLKEGRVETPQDAKAFTGAILDNERLANPTASRPDVQVNTQINQPSVIEIIHVEPK